MTKRSSFLFIAFFIFVGFIGFSNPRYVYAGCSDSAPCWHLCGDSLPDGCSNGCCCQPGAPDYGDGIPVSDGGTCSCCSGGGGGGDQNRVVGRIYDDHTGVTRFWQPAMDDSAPFSCGSSYPTDSNGEEGGTTIVYNIDNNNSDWECNPGPFYKRRAELDGAGPHGFRLVPPPGYECVSWSITYPYDAYPSDSGTGCNASVMLGNDDWDNHLWWRIQPINNPPTVSIVSPVASPHVSSSGADVTYTFQASDPDGNLTRAEIWRRQYDATTGTWLGSWIQVGASEPCSGSTCTITRTWSAPGSGATGNWWIAANAFDTVGGQCTGNPGPNPLDLPSYPDSYIAGWDNCGDSSRMDTLIADAPTSQILSPVPPGDIFSPSPTHVRALPGVPLSITSQANDATGNLAQTSLHRIQFDPSTDSPILPYTAIAVGPDVACSGYTCQHTQTWTPPLDGSETGWWILTINSRNTWAYSDPSIYTRCTGNSYNPFDDLGSYINPPLYPTAPWAPRDWNNCGNSSRLLVRVVEAVDVEGWIWDSTDEACSYADKGNRELDPSAVDDISVTNATTGSNDVSLNGSGNYPSYTINQVPMIDALSLCVDLSELAQQANATYSLSCVEGPNGSGPQSDTCALVNLDPSGDPATVHMGFDLDSRGWFTSIDGDIYGGCDSCSESISESVPAPALVQAASFEPFAVSGNGNLFSNSGVAINDDTAAYAETNVFLSNIGASSTWEESYLYEVPVNALDIESITNCTDMFTDSVLRTDEVYYTSSTCLQQGIDGVGAQSAGQRTYKINNSSNGVVVIYATGSSEIVFGAGESEGSTNNRFFRAHEQSNDRVMIVTEAPVRFSSDLGKSFTNEPTETTRPFVEAAIITSDDITFESTGDVETEKTVIVEGPLIVGGGDVGKTIILGKDRGLNNDKPAQVIVYNPMYLTELTDMERSGTNPVANFSGLFISPVYWE